MFYSIRLKSIITIFLLAVFTAVPVIYILLDNVSHESDNLSKENVKKITIHNTEKISAILNKEIALALKMSDSSIIKKWILNENNNEIKEDAIKELESFKRLLKDNSYFLAIKSSNNYYFSDKYGICNNKESCYKLDPKDPNAGWFYSTLKSNKDYMLNIDYDEKLNQTKVWLNVLVYHEAKPIAIIGTGIDLSDFINEILKVNDEVTSSSFFFDKDGYIQAHKNRELISFRTITKQEDKLVSIFDFMKLSKNDKAIFTNTISKLIENPNELSVLHMELNGKDKIISLKYIPEIEWFSIATIDHNHLEAEFFFENSYLLITIILSFGAFTLIVLIFLNYVIIKPTEKIYENIKSIENGNYDIKHDIKSNDEFEKLSFQLQKMAVKIGNYTSELESEVKKRTEELEKIAVTDPLTNLLNRKGVNDQWKYEYSRASRQKYQIGMLMLDIDFFKNINDTYGHDVGDKVIVEVANTLKRLLRPYDIIGRWGGEEYLMIFTDMNLRQLDTIAEKIRATLEKSVIQTEKGEITFTVSIGGCVAKLYEEFDHILNKTDKALYEAKRTGRNKFVEFNKIYN